MSKKRKVHTPEFKAKSQGIPRSDQGLEDDQRTGQSISGSPGPDKHLEKAGS